MRLLNAKTLELVQFNGTEKPRYSILSHTWGKEEVTFQDLGKPGFEEKAGYVKIKGCRQQTVADGLEWFWIDTCCIDKSSSAELSEAINSMYHWYEYAEVCYAYLSDVPPGEDPMASGSAFRKSRWFTRGWTLQELLVPPQISFYDQSWTFIDQKSNMIPVISSVTGIDVFDMAQSMNPRDDVCIGVKLAWAARRRTTRVEDMAYCLMGILGVNMPLLYGEGTKAFIRLQEEVMKVRYDHSILAWGLGATSSFSRLVKHHAVISVLAPRPSLFSKLPKMKLAPTTGSHYLSTNLGLLIELPVISLGGIYALGILDCHSRSHITGKLHPIALPLWIKTRENGAVPVAYRVHGAMPFPVTGKGIPKAVRKSLYISQSREGACMPRLQDKSSVCVTWEDNGYSIADCFPSSFGWLESKSGVLEFAENNFLVRFFHPTLDDILVLYIQDARGLHKSFNHEGTSGHFALASVKKSNSITSWELLLQPNFDRIDFDQLKMSFIWDTEIMVNDNYIIRIKFRKARAKGIVVEIVSQRVLNSPVMEFLSGGEDFSDSCVREGTFSDRESIGAEDVGSFHFD